MKTVNAIITILATALALAGCSRPDPAIASAEPAWKSSGAAAPEGERLVEAAISNAPWYAERFEKLGFYVFPAPEPLPSFSVRSMTGVDTGVAALPGKVVLLNFWATWCPPCRAEMPSIQVLHEKLRGTAFEVMAISVAEKASTVRDFLKSNPYTYTMYLDESGAASTPFAGRGIPTTFVLDKQGRAIAGIVGARSYDGPEVVSLFRELAERLP